MLRLFEVLAFAAPPPGKEQDPRAAMMQMILMFGALGLMFYFMMIRPQQKQRKEQENMLKNLRAGDKVLLSSGIIGIISSVKDKTLMVKIADNVKIEVLKTAVSNVIQKSEDERTNS